MSDFINTIESLGDDAVLHSLLTKTIVEFKDDKVKSVGGYVFDNCKALTTVELPNVENITGERAFYSCSGIVDLSIPKLKTVTGDYVFSGIGASIVDFPELETTGGHLFRESANLETARLPKIKVIPGYCFYGGCKKLKNVYAPVATTVDVSAFRYCIALESISLPEVTTLTGNEVFYNCTGLKSVNLPKLTTISGTSVFRGCTALESIDLPLLETAGSNLFYDCGKLRSVNLPNLVSAGPDFFRACKVLEAAIFPKLEAVPNRFVYYNGGTYDSLKNVSIPSAKTIGSSAFYGCAAITILDLPVVTSIDATAFYSCSSLATVILRNTAGVANLANTNAFTSTPIASGTGYIYVPSALLADYQTATNWSTYAAQFRALEDYTVDGTTTGELDETKI